MCGDDVVKLNKVAFSCELINGYTFDKQELKKMVVVFERDKENPVLLIESENVTIEDRWLPINSNDVIKGVSKIDFNLKNDFSLESEYSGKKWKLILNDKEYDGVLEDPYYIVELKRVIKYSAIELYAIKKLANYFKKWTFIYLFLCMNKDFLSIL